MLNDKTVVIGVTGGIAAYKALEVVSSLKKAGADVYVIMTKSATEFVKPLIFQSLSHNPVSVDMFGEVKHWDVEHIALADKADLMLIVPATANIIGKVANGIADDMLSTTIMATKAKVVFCPAMNVNMYQNPIVQENLSYLQKKGYQIIEADAGYLACGYKGKGRLPQPEEIVKNVSAYLLSDKDLVGQKILITAGGTQEPLDPVRYLSNYSSGKMGYSLARMAKVRGAEVTLISAPTNLDKPSGIGLINVQTASEMYNEVFEYKDQQDIIIMAAAVADYAPKEVVQSKIKKGAGGFNLELKRNQDILASLGQDKAGQVLVGFAAESDDLLRNATNKLRRKNLDIIVANDITDDETGFASDTNEVFIISSDNQERIPKKRKLEIANEVLDRVVNLLNC